MKQLKCLIFVLLLVCIAGCQIQDKGLYGSLSTVTSISEEEEPVSSSSSISDDTPVISGQDFIKVDKFEINSLKYFSSNPSIFESKLLYSDAEMFQQEKEQNISEFDLLTGNEKQLALYSKDARWDGENYYWIHPGKEDNTYGDGIWQGDGSDEGVPLYTVKENRRILPRLAFNNDFLVWQEEVWSSGELAYWEIYAMECKTQEVFFVAERNWCSTPFDILVINNGFLTYCDSIVSTEYLIHVIDLSKRDEIFIHKITSPVNDVAFDGDWLVWTDTFRASWIPSFHAYCYSTGEEKKITITTNGKQEDGAGINVIQGRYVIYNYWLKVRIYDLKENQLIYRSEADPLLGDAELSYYFNLDEKSDKAIFIKHGPEEMEKGEIVLFDFSVQK